MASHRRVVGLLPVALLSAVALGSCTVTQHPDASGSMAASAAGNASAGVATLQISHLRSGHLTLAVGQRVALTDPDTDNRWSSMIRDDGIVEFHDTDAAGAYTPELVALAPGEVEVTLNEAATFDKVSFVVTVE